MGFQHNYLNMNKLNFGHENNSPFRILCLGAHSDDIEIGCAGTLLQLIPRNACYRSNLGGFQRCGAKRRRARNSAEEFLKDVFTTNR